jgi:predicted phage terminase large subunit-like protein
MLLPCLRDVDAELARRSLAEFTRQAWHVIEPETDLVWNWHIDAVCLHLETLIPIENRYLFEQMSDGEKAQLIHIMRLLINIPPGHMKSILMCVMLPAWVWSFWPAWRGLFGSYAMDLAVRDSLRCRDVITSEWYQDSFRPDWTLKTDQNLKEYYANTHGGIRQCISVGAKTTGFRGHFVGVDDPLNATDAQSEAKRKEAIRWLDTALPSRMNDPRTGSRAMIMQRLHEEDPSGHVIAKGGWIHLCLPSQFEPDRKCVTPIGWSDPRTEAGELLFPEVYNAEVLAQARLDLGSAAYAGQHQQKPVPAGGIIFKRHWWRYWVPVGVKLPPVRVQDEEGKWHEIEAIELPKHLEIVIQSWDMAFKDTKASDKVAAGVWGKQGANAFLLDRRNKRMSFTESVEAVQALTRVWPQSTGKLIEDKANGPAVIDTLKDKIPGIIPVNPQGDKEGRAYAVTPYIEAGNVYVPHPSLYAWVDDYLNQHDGFPLMTFKDEVDQTTQALTRLLHTTVMNSKPKTVGNRPAVAQWKPVGMR